MQDEVQTALESFFRVGESGGKTPDRFDELMKVCLSREPCLHMYLVVISHFAAHNCQL